MGLLGRMLWQLPWRLLLWGSHLVKTCGNLARTHMLPIRALIELMLVVNMLGRSTGVLLHGGCVRGVSGLRRCCLWLNDRRSRIHRMTRLGIML